MDRSWAGTTFGNGWMHKWAIRVLRYVDVRILYGIVSVFVIPVCLCVNRSCGITYRRFRNRHAFGRLKSSWYTYLNHCMFAQVVIDRFAMFGGRHFNVEVDGYDIYKSLASRPDGFIQLSAHIGNYELAGYSLIADKKRFNALVFGGEKESMMRNRGKLFSKTNINMIAISPDIGHLFEIDEALSKGETVSMPADRIIGSEKKITLRFMGASADFPYGPFSLATMRSLEVIAVNVVKTGLKRYRVIVSNLNYDKSASRKEQIAQLSQAYVDELERVLKLYPDQWFNYFEFWDE